MEKFNLLKKVQKVMRRVDGCIKRHSTPIMVILTFSTVVIACLSAHYSKESAKYASRTVRWYEHPSPLLITLTNAEEEIKEKGAYFIPIISNYSPREGITNMTSIELCRKIDFWIHNAGRIPVTGVWIDIIVHSQNFSFRVAEIETPISSFSYDFKQKVAKWNGGYLEIKNEYGVPDFVPNRIRELIPHLRLPDIEPNQTIHFYVSLLSVTPNATGVLIVSILSVNTGPYTIQVPLRS